jgi:hypothetical protein
VALYWEFLAFTGIHCITASPIRSRCDDDAVKLLLEKQKPRGSSGHPNFNSFNSSYWSPPPTKSSHHSQALGWPRGRRAGVWSRYSKPNKTVYSRQLRTRLLLRAAVAAMQLHISLSYCFSFLRQTGMPLSHATKAAKTWTLIVEQPQGCASAIPCCCYAAESAELARYKFQDGPIRTTNTFIPAKIVLARLASHPPSPFLCPLSYT